MGRYRVVRVQKKGRIDYQIEQKRFGLWITQRKHTMNGWLKLSFYRMEEAVYWIEEDRKKKVNEKVVVWEC